MHVVAESEGRFCLLVEGVRDYAIYMLNPEGRIVSWNTGAERLKGWRAEEALGQHVSMLHPPDPRAQGRPDKELRLAKEQGVFREEARRIREDGSEFIADRDITERKHAEEALRDLTSTLERRVEERTRVLEEVNEQLRAFAYTVGRPEHDSDLRFQRC